MQNWKNKFDRIEVRFATVVLLIALVFATLFIQPVIVRVFGTPLTLTYQSDYIDPGSELFGVLTIAQIPVDELPPSIRALYEMEDFDEAVQLLNEETFYITLQEVDGITVRDQVVLSEPSADYIVATFDWFLDKQLVDWNEDTPWQDRYTGIKLRLDTVQRYFVPTNLTNAQRFAIEQGTATARYVLYQGNLYLIDPLL
jgi:hypothetical protein